MTKEIKVLILGGGFGGVETVKRLANLLEEYPANVRLISDKSYFTFTPFLHRVFGSKPLDHSSKFALEKLSKAKKFQFTNGRVTKVDLSKKKVHLEDGGYFAYDYLVYALGATTHYYDVPGSKEYSIPFKTYTDALELRKVVKAAKRSIKAFEISVVGGGATGVKIASELADYINKDPHINIRLIEGVSRLGKDHSTPISDYMYKSLVERNVDLVLGEQVTKVSKYSIFTDKKEFSSDLSIWTAGLTPINVFQQLVEIDTTNRILVNDNLQLPNHPEVFIMGDAAQMASEDRKYMQLAQVAFKQAEVTSKNILALVQGKIKLEEFRYRSDGTLISLGKKNSVGEVLGFTIKGKLAWLAWSLYYKYREFIWGR